MEEFIDDGYYLDYLNVKDGDDIDDVFPNSIDIWREKANDALFYSFEEYDSDDIEKLVFTWTYFARDLTHPEWAWYYTTDGLDMIEKFGEEQLINKSNKINEICKEVGANIGLDISVL